jgi:midasin (ATPase involved in ribosome maturation)
MLAQAKEAALSARAPFQWVDGPLVTAMRQGEIILIDELNLAEDAVLERMNRSSSDAMQCCGSIVVAREAHNQQGLPLH